MGGWIGFRVIRVLVESGFGFKIGGWNKFGWIRWVGSKWDGSFRVRVISNRNDIGFRIQNGRLNRVSGDTSFGWIGFKIGDWNKFGWIKWVGSKWDESFRVRVISNRVIVGFGYNCGLGRVGSGQVLLKPNGIGFQTFRSPQYFLFRPLTSLWMLVIKRLTLYSCI